MKRRSFIRGILATCVAPMFLPGGGRIWKATFEQRWEVNPEWVDAPLEYYIMYSAGAIDVVRQNAIEHNFWKLP